MTLETKTKRRKITSLTQNKTSLVAFMAITMLLSAHIMIPSAEAFPDVLKPWKWPGYLWDGGKWFWDNKWTIAKIGAAITAVTSAAVIVVALIVLAGTTGDPKIDVEDVCNRNPEHDVCENLSSMAYSLSSSQKKNMQKLLDSNPELKKEVLTVKKLLTSSDLASISQSVNTNTEIDPSIIKKISNKIDLSSGALASFVKELAKSPYAPPTDLVTVKITRIYEQDSPDNKNDWVETWNSKYPMRENDGSGDYYVHVRIGDTVHKINEKDNISGKDIRPNWKFVEPINSNKFSGKIPIKIVLKDYDKDSKNEGMDTSRHGNNIDLTFDLRSQKWTGDVSSSTKWSEGDGRNSAEVYFEISSQPIHSTIKPFPKPLTPSSIPDWNNAGTDNPDDGDPLIFSMTDKSVNVIRNWPEQHKSFLTEFDLYATGENVTLSRTLDDGTMTMFLDLNGDGELSDGTEWLYDQNENVYKILSKPIIDSNQNDWFDYSDNLWNLAMIKNGDQYYSASELGIVAFNWSNAIKGYGDMHGANRQYTDCLYDGVYLYPDCVAISENHFAISAYNKNSILVNDGRILDSFGSVMGHLDTSENKTAQIP